MRPGYAADDGAALHFVGTRLHQAVSSRPQARAHALQMIGGSIREREIEAAYLAAPGNLVAGAGSVAVATPRLVALGGHEFRFAPAELATVDHLLRLTGVERPRVCLLPTASGDPTGAIQSFYSVLDRFDCEGSHVSLFRLERERVDLSRHLLEQDLIYVAGGSMLNLVAIWRAHRLFPIMREAWGRGALIAGQSAGAMCWFERGITASGGPARGWPTASGSCPGA